MHMKSGYDFIYHEINHDFIYEIWIDIMISYSVISCVIYACIYDRLDYDIMGMISYLKL